MDEPALELVRDWLARASRDLRSAHLLAAADDPPLDIAIYHLPAGCREIHQGVAPRRGCPIPKDP